MRAQAFYGRCVTLLIGEDGGQLSPWAIERAMRKARSEVKSLPAGFRYHDLRQQAGQDGSGRHTSKYSSNSCGVGRSRTASSSFSRL